MTLNISAKQSISAPVDPAIGPSEARPLIREVVDELTSWNPREFISAVRRWHHGAISLVHLNILTILEAEGSLSMGGLAEALGISVAGVTGVIDRMEERGLVERGRDAADRRVVLVHPTAEARTVFGEMDDRRRLLLARLLGRLTDEELTGLLRGHRALREARAAMGRVAGGKPEVAAAPDGTSAPGATR